MTEPPPAGWYPDPGNSGQQRYWDGNAWTESFAPGSASAAPIADAAKKPIYKRTWFIVVAVLIGLSVIGNMTSGGPSTAPAPSATEGTPPPAKAEAKPPVAEPEPAQPDMTMGQKQAVQSAQNYLSMGGFSRKKLIDQLVFEDFSQADAEFAVNYINPDWNPQAEQSARSYVEMGGFSRQKLLDQLAFEGFTKAQAEYGAKAVGY